MDILGYDTDYSVIICKICKHALLPGKSAVTMHLNVYHQPLFAPRTIRAFVASLDCYQDPIEVVQLKRLPLDAPPHPLLEIFDNGLACKLCDRDPKILRTREAWQPI